MLLLSASSTPVAAACSPPHHPCFPFSHPPLSFKTLQIIHPHSVGPLSLLFCACISHLLAYIPGEGNGTPLQYSCLENPMDGGAWWAAVHGVVKSRTRLNDFTFMHWRRKWQPTPVFLPGESQGWGSLVGCRLWGHTESDTTEAT